MENDSGSNGVYSLALAGLTHQPHVRQRIFDDEVRMHASP